MIQDLGVGTETRTCPHMLGCQVKYVCNDGRSAPTIFLLGLRHDAVISLTNQVIRVSCPDCFERIRLTARKL